MRELTTRISFNQPSLGNTKQPDGRYLMPRSPSGEIIFLNTWWNATFTWASKALGRHQDLVREIRWDQVIDGTILENRPPYRRKLHGHRRRVALHEAFWPGQQIGVSCVVPDGIPTSDFEQLMRLVGRYQGISPYMPKKFGFFEVVSVRQRCPEPTPSQEIEIPK